MKIMYQSKYKPKPVPANFWYISLDEDELAVIYKSLRMSIVETPTAIDVDLANALSENIKELLQSVGKC
jgi:hypothetical protein